MVKPYKNRLADLRKANLRDESVEGLVGYDKRIRDLAEDELLIIMRNKWNTINDKFEACAQIFEAKRDKTVY